MTQSLCFYLTRSISNNTFFTFALFTYDYLIFFATTKCVKVINFTLDFIFSVDLQVSSQVSEIKLNGFLQIRLNYIKLNFRFKNDSVYYFTWQECYSSLLDRRSRNFVCSTYLGILLISPRDMLIEADDPFESCANSTFTETIGSILRRYESLTTRYPLP